MTETTQTQQAPNLHYKAPLPDTMMGYSVYAEPRPNGVDYAPLADHLSEYWAKRIVTACNSHEALVAFAKRVLAWARRPEQIDWSVVEHDAEIVLLSVKFQATKTKQETQP